MKKINKPTVIDLGYYYAKEINDYREIIRLYESSSGHHHLIAEEINLYVVRHLNQEVEVKIDGVNYLFFKGSLSRFWLPFRLHKIIKNLKPDIILLHGFLNPLQALLLTFQSSAKIIIQHHGGGLPKGFNGFLQKFLKYKVKNYLFTTSEQAAEFKEMGLILSKSNIYAIMEGSTNKIKIEKQKARLDLGINSSEKMFLWVGRLDENKDPITVLNGIEYLFTMHSNARLYMIYSDDKLENAVKNKIEKSQLLSDKVTLIGKLAHSELDSYYCSADFFVLGSHYEGSGYALCEAMACGCIPIVTNIPSFRMMTNNGKIGALWQVSNSNSFIEAAEKVMNKNLEMESELAVDFFKENLSFKAIAKKQVEMIREVFKS